MTEIAEPGDYGFCGPKYHCAVGRESSSIDDLVLYSDFCRHNRREVGLRPASTIKGYEPPFPAALLWKAGRSRIGRKTVYLKILPKVNRLLTVKAREVGMSRGELIEKVVLARLK